MAAISTNEIPNLGNLERLIQSKALSKAEIHALKSLKEKIDLKTKSVKVDYTVEGFGRFKAVAKGGKYKTSTTATGMKREIRNILYGDLYDDLDIANASGEVMCQLFKRYGLVTEKMSYLNSNREAVLQEIMNYHDQKLERATAKDILIEVFFCGAGHNSYYWEFNPFTNKKEVITQYALPPFVEDLKREYSANIGQIVALERFRELKEHVRKTKREKCEKSGVSYEEPWMGQYGAIIYQDEERKILEVMVKAIRKIEKERGIPDALGALIYDGLHVKKELEIINYKEQLEAYIQGETGYKLKLEIKDMTVAPESKSHYLGDKEVELTYEARRAEFEKTRFKTKNGKYPFHTVRGDDIVSRDKTAFSVANEDWMVGATDFLKEWFADPSKRSYEEIEYSCINDEEHRPNVFYAFPTLRYKTLTSTSTEEQRADNIRFFQEYISLIVDAPIFTNEQKNQDQMFKEKSSKWMTFWIADILLNPHTKGKQPIAVILCAKQGAGKTSLRNLLERLLGNKCVHHTDNPTKNGDILHEFNSTLKYKLFLEFEEINMKTHSSVADSIKQLITNHTHTITHKGQDSIDVRAIERALFTTNNPVSVLIEKGDRRYVAFAMSNKRVGDTKYWSDEFYRRLYDNNFIKDIADYLCSFKEQVSLYPFRDERPITPYYKTLLQLGLPAELDFLKDKLFYTPDSIESYKNYDTDSYIIPSSVFCELYNEWRRAHSLEAKVSSKSFTAKMESLPEEYGIHHKKMASSNAFTIDITKAKATLKKDFAITEDEPELMRILNRSSREE